MIRQEFAEEDLPTNSYYGDGEPIESTTIHHRQEVYRSHTKSFPWQENDVLMVDNLMVCHGRQPFVGDRKVLVAMAGPMSWDRLE